MIVNTKTGVLISGTIAKTPELKFVGQNNRPVLKFSVRYGSERDEAGKRKGKYLYVDVWGGAEDLSDMLKEEDPVIITAHEVKSREYNGKTYYSVSAEGLYPGASTIVRWLQQVVSFIPTPSAATDISGHELYKGETLADYDVNKATTQDADDYVVVDENEDLPF